MTAMLFCGGPLSGQFGDYGGRCHVEVARPVPPTPPIGAEGAVEIAIRRGRYESRYNEETERHEYVWLGWNDEI